MADAAEVARIADEHARLLDTVANYEHAPADLSDTNDLIQSLDKGIEVREAHMAKLIEKRKSEHKDVEKLQRSSTKRFLVRMTQGGREGLERKLEKEEREYVEAAQAEHNESQAIAELKEAAQNAREKKADLEREVATRKDLLKQIDDIYMSAFDGPSPDFPEEDAAEEDLRAAEVHFAQVQAILSHEKTVSDILNRAAACANDAFSALQSANMSATYDTFGVGGIWAEMAERDDILRAQTLASQAQRHLERARGSQPLVDAVPCGQIVNPEWLNVVFDNMYTMQLFLEKIKQSLATVRRFQEGILAECAKSSSRVEEHTRTAADARAFLSSRRRGLVALRREILRRIHEEGGIPSGPLSESAPPLYTSQPEVGARAIERTEPSSRVSGNVLTMSVSGSSLPSPPMYESPAPLLRNSQSLPSASRLPPSPPRGQTPPTVPRINSFTRRRYPPPPGSPPARPLSTGSVTSISASRSSPPSFWPGPNVSARQYPLRPPRSPSPSAFSSFRASPRMEMPQPQPHSHPISSTPTRAVNMPIAPLGSFGVDARSAPTPVATATTTGTGAKIQTPSSARTAGASLDTTGTGQPNPSASLPHSRSPSPRPAGDQDLGVPSLDPSYNPGVTEAPTGTDTTERDGQDEAPRTSFASNNPYRFVS
ncbi:hypothetical protein M0805_001987 [Coniferiporia weirii]|nr:hypothetical protein M0805_001987 [Coniferiporia weirii]